MTNLPRHRGIYFQMNSSGKAGGEEALEGPCPKPYAPREDRLRAGDELRHTLRRRDHWRGFHSDLYAPQSCTLDMNSWRTFEARYDLNYERYRESTPHLVRTEIHFNELCKYSQNFLSFSATSCMDPEIVHICLCKK